MRKTKEDLKTQILDTTIALFIEKGIEKVSTRELTERLSLSRSHIYYYFSNWQTLCIEALSRYMQNELDEFAAEIAELTPAEKIKSLVKNYLPDSQDAGWQLYSSLWQIAAHNRVYAELAESFTLKWDIYIAEIINEGIAAGHFRKVNSARVARQLSAMLNGYADVLCINASPDKQSESVDDIMDFIQLILY